MTTAWITSPNYCAFRNYSKIVRIFLNLLTFCISIKWISLTPLKWYDIYTRLQTLQSIFCSSNSLQNTLGSVRLEGESHCTTILNQLYCLGTGLLKNIYGSHSCDWKFWVTVMLQLEVLSYLQQIIPLFPELWQVLQSLLQTISPVISTVKNSENTAMYKEWYKNILTEHL